MASFMNVTIGDESSTAHAEILPLSCAICQEIFKNENLLAAHQEVHGEEKQLKDQPRECVSGVLSLLKCSLCFKKFNSRLNLSFHERKCEGHGSIRCSRCVLTFPSIRQLTRHNHKLHIKRLPLSSSLKGLYPRKIFSERKSDKGNFLQCSECQRKFLSKKDLAFHNVLGHCSDARDDAVRKENKYHCDSCALVCNERNQLIRHMQRHTSTRTKKSQHLRYSWPRVYHRYVKVQSWSQGSKKCSLLERTVKTLDVSISSLSKPNHTSSDAMTEGSLYESTGNLMKDVKSVEGQASPVTIKCEIESDSDNDINSDQLENTSFLGGYDSQHVDGNSFDNSGSGFQDDNESDSERDNKKVGTTWSCSQCDFTSSKKWGLMSHLRSHTGDRPYMCSECSRQFNCSSNAHKHIRRVHAGQATIVKIGSLAESNMVSYAFIKKKNCGPADSISYSFVRKNGPADPYYRDGNGKRNFQSGSDECAQDAQDGVSKHTVLNGYLVGNLWYCTLCNYSSERKWSLLSHLRYHSGDKPYKCSACSMRFGGLGSASNHVKKKHAGQATVLTVGIMRPNNNKTHYTYIEDEAEETGCDIESSKHHEISTSSEATSKNNPIPDNVQIERANDSCSSAGDKETIKPTPTFVENNKQHCLGKNSGSNQKKKAQSRMLMGVVRWIRTNELSSFTNISLPHLSGMDMLLKTLKVTEESEQFGYNIDQMWHCSHCEYSCKRKCSLMCHLRQHMGHKPFTCSLCSRQFTCKANITKHMSTYHIGTWKRSKKKNNGTVDGDSSFIDDNDNKNAESNYESEITLIKEECDSDNQEDSTFNQTTSIYQSSIDEGDATEIGVKNEHYFNQDTAEMNSAGNSTGYDHSLISNGDSLVTENSSFEAVDNEPLWECSQCSYSSKKRGGLMLHLRTHTGEKPYMCSECSKVFTHRSNAAKHIRRCHPGIASILKVKDLVQ